MVSPRVAKEVGNRLGLVEEVEWKQRQDNLNFFMWLKFALLIVKPLRRGGFIAGSDGVHTWVSYKYERLPLFCHYCGLLGHDVKHCASHFAIIQNGGEVDYQYGDYLRAMEGVHDLSHQETLVIALVLRGSKCQWSLQITVL